MLESVERLKKKHKKKNKKKRVFDEVAPANRIGPQRTRRRGEELKVGHFRL